jgi:hypothetical protein
VCLHPCWLTSFSQPTHCYIRWLSPNLSCSQYIVSGWIA